MARIHHDRPTKGAPGASTLDRTRAVASRKKKKGYKVMMEVVEQEKKKLRSVVSIPFYEEPVCIDA